VGVVEWSFQLVVEEEFFLLVVVGVGFFPLKQGVVVEPCPFLLVMVEVGPLIHLELEWLALEHFDSLEPTFCHLPLAHPSYQLVLFQLGLFYLQPFCLLAWFQLAFDLWLVFLREGFRFYPFLFYVFLSPKRFHQARFQ
jgi:hypothetical protein